MADSNDNEPDLKNFTAVWHMVVRVYRAECRFRNGGSADY